MALKKKRPESRLMIRLQSSKYGIYIFWLSILLIFLLLLMLTIGVIIPMIEKAKEEEDPIVLNEFITADSAQPEGSSSFKDLSDLQYDAQIEFARINDPYIHGEEIVYSTGETKDGSFKYTRLMVFNTASGTSKEIENIECKYDNIINCLISPEFIVYIDSCADAGGRIMGYDRTKGEAFLIKEFLYAAPKLSLSGNILAFMQQTGDFADKLYVYDLATRESVCLKTFRSESTFPSPAAICDGRVIYAAHKYEEGKLTSSLIQFNLSGGTEKMTAVPHYAASPKTNGKHTIYLAGEPGAQNELWLVESNGDISMITDGVLNCDIGDGFAAYTKDGAVYAYVFDTKMTYKLSSELTRGLLVCVNHSQVCWYDVTSGFGDIDMVKYAAADFS
ncbi:MAG: hypothetical protein E7332_02960 [Clostridiales bacterium]|nr:hypothetical protein [Clostridiales bacterium]